MPGTAGPLAAEDVGFAIAYDANGSQVHVVGHTKSSNFPLVPHTFYGYGGAVDAFVARITMP